MKKNFLKIHLELTEYRIYVNASYLNITKEAKINLVVWLHGKGVSLVSENKQCIPYDQLQIIGFSGTAMGPCSMADPVFQYKDKVFLAEEIAKDGVFPSHQDSFNVFRDDIVAENYATLFTFTETIRDFVPLPRLVYFTSEFVEEYKEITCKDPFQDFSFDDLDINWGKTEDGYLRIAVLPEQKCSNLSFKLWNPLEICVRKRLQEDSCNLKKVDQALELAFYCVLDSDNVARWQLSIYSGVVMSLMDPLRFRGVYTAYVTDLFGKDTPSFEGWSEEVEATAISIRIASRFRSPEPLTSDDTVKNQKEESSYPYHC